MLPEISLALALFCGQATAPAKPSLKLDPQVFVEPGAAFRITCETNCRNVRWTVVGVKRLPAEWVKDPEKNFVGIAPMTGGTYKVDVLGSLSDEWAEATTLLVVGQQPVPPGPGPIPPPLPGPPPAPNDPLLAALQAAYTADPSATKAQDAANLRQVYVSSAGFVMQPAAATNINTVADLNGAIRRSGAMVVDQGGPMRLQPMRQAISEELKKALPADAVLDETLRAKAQQVFLRIATALGAVR